MEEKRKNPFPWMVVGGGLLLVLAALTYAHSINPPQSVMTPTPGSVSQVQRVSLEDAKAAYDNGRAVFLDVRDATHMKQVISQERY